MIQKTKVCHLTSAHERDDIRIFYKMCTSLSKYDFDTKLIVADGISDEIKSGVSIINVGKRQSNRIKRMITTVNKVYKKALEVNADIYHLHDPELIRIGLKLRKKGKIVIFDAHEDLAKQVLSKPYLNLFSKYIIYYYVKTYELFSCKKYNLIITATKSIKDKFLKINKNSIDINNYPLSSELFNFDKNHKENKLNEIVYVGAISEIRGIIYLIKALEYLPNVKLNLIGKFNNRKLEEDVKLLKGWNQVNYLGFLDRDKASIVMKKSKVGLVTFLNVPNHVDSQPNKMFEYMSHTLPLVTSNFPLWKEIVNGNNCGICVDPTNPKKIADAIRKLLLNEELAYKYAKNGYNIVLKKYNWNIEEKKLINVYKDLVNENINNTRS